MNDRLSNLGESLAGIFRDKMAQWASLDPDSMEYDLSASSGLAADIVRLEEGWLALAATGQTQLTDFIPQDLLTGFDATALPPDEQLPPSRVAGKGDTYPFTSPSESGFYGMPASFPAGAEPPAAENKAAGSPTLPQRDGHPDFQVGKPTPSHAESGNAALGSTEDAGQHVAGNISRPGPTKWPGIANGPVQHSGLPMQGRLDDAVANTPPQMPAQETPAADTSDSFWTQPLQNLGDFATRIVYPAIEVNEAVQQPGPAQAVLPGAGRERAAVNGQAGDEPAILPESMRRPGTITPDDKVVPFPGRPDAFLPQTPGATAGSRLFGQEAGRNLPDTDDLLEALTERIVRDFHRYYP